MGHIGWASEVFNCSAPDTGNMEVFMRYGTKEQKRKWLRPLMDGEIRSAFLMTEPAVASSDATNIETRIERDGDHYVINGRKWWSSGVGDPRCKIAILMGKTDPTAAKHQQQSQILVPLDTPGIKVEKMLPVFGYDDAPHGHAQVLLENVRVPAGEHPARRGPRLRDRAGPARPGPHPSLHAHHRQGRGGAGEDGAAAVVAHRLRQEDHRAFGLGAAHRRSPHQHRDDPAVCLKAADMMDKVGNKTAQLEIAMIKVAAPNMALKIIDDAIQAYGGGGVSDEAGLAKDYADIRTLRLADGPDEVHNRAIARLELRKYANSSTLLTGSVHAAPSMPSFRGDATASNP